MEHCPTTIGPSKTLQDRQRCSCGTRSAACAAQPAKTTPNSEPAGTTVATGSPDSANGYDGASERRKSGTADCDTSCQATGGRWVGDCPLVASHPPPIAVHEPTCTQQCVHAGILELVQLLQKRGTAVALVSEGFRQLIDPIATSLDIPTSHVHASCSKTTAPTQVLWPSLPF